MNLLKLAITLRWLLCLLCVILSLKISAFLFFDKMFMKFEKVWWILGRGVSVFSLKECLRAAARSFQRDREVFWEEGCSGLLAQFCHQGAEAGSKGVIFCHFCKNGPLEPVFAQHLPTKVDAGISRFF